MKNIINREHINYLNIMAEELETEHLSIFAGAGISIDSGFVDWKGLMKPVIEQLEINANMDLALAAQFYENEYGRHDINKLIFDEFNRVPRKNEVITLLGKLPIKSYWTTNYDSLIEDTLSASPIEKIVDLKINKDQFKYHVPQHDITVYKMHGDKRYPDDAIITKNDYETYDSEREVFTKALFTELITNTFLFIGFSFSDPNLERILSIVKHTFDNNAPKNHYCFMRRVNKKDYCNYAQFKQDANFQKLRIREMRRYGIQTILIDDFSQITTCLKYIKSKLDQKRVFISGSITKRLISKDSEQAEFVQYLAQKLIENKYKIVTGFGQNIGNYLLVGACRNMRINQAKKIHETIEIYPLVTIENDAEALRKELISNCGCIITLFGKTPYQKNSCPAELNSDGVYQEFKIAEKENLTLLPVGCTGNTSKYLWEYTNNNRKIFYNNDIFQHWNNLGKSNIRDKEKILDSILKLLEYKNIQEQEKLERELLSQINNVILSEEYDLKKVFLSFHYNSSHELADKFRKIINGTQKYVATEEEEAYNKTSKQGVFNWIDQKIENTVATVLIFDESIFDSVYVEYELEKSVKRNNRIVIITTIDIKKTQKLIKQKYPLLRDTASYFKSTDINCTEDILSILGN